MLNNDDQIEDEIVEEPELSYEESSEDGEESSTKDKLKDLREKLKKCVAEKQEYLTGWQKERADFVNFKSEEDKRKAELVTYTKEKTIHEFLGVLDSFDMAFANKEAWEKVDKNWRIGVEYIYAQFLGVLGDHGVKQINEIDVEFNPEFHQSLETVDTTDEKKDHLVAEVIQKGYIMNDKVIRPARVHIYHYKQ
ncbi:MAG: nucleotide exchange factor GrpE [Candidatus Paceibacterota bacterium]|jgi:molecular chaperone GrpE